MIDTTSSPLPCPFCGETPTAERQRHDSPVGLIIRHDCHMLRAVIDVGTDPDRAETDTTIARWNTRS